MHVDVHVRRRHLVEDVLGRESDALHVRFDLGRGIPFDRNRTFMHGNRLCLTTHKLVIADLAERRFVVPPSKDNQPQDRHGFAVRAAADKLIKFVHGGREGTHTYLVDLNTGAVEPGLLQTQTDPLRELPSRDPMPVFGEVVLLRDDHGISAWSSALQ